MSNNLVSQQLSIQNRQMGHMEPVSKELDSSNMQMGMMGPVSSGPASQQFAISNQQMGLVEPMPSNPGPQNSTISDKPAGPMEPNVSNIGSPLFSMPSQQVGEMEAMSNNLGSQRLLLPSKRKAVVEPMFEDSIPEQLLLPNKHVAQIESSPSAPGLHQLSAPNRKTVLMQSISSNPGLQKLHAPNKKMVRNESISSKSGPQRVQTPKSRSVQMEPSPKAESFEAVRSKMRESLAAALAFVCQDQDKAPNEEKNAQNEATIIPPRTKEDCKPAQSTSTHADADFVPGNSINTSPSKESSSVKKANDGKSTSAEISTKGSLENSVQTWKCDGQVSRCNPLLPDEDVSFSDNFFVKDELLQGNGLSWALDLDAGAVETKEFQTPRKPTSACGDVGDQVVQSPQNLAFKIEVELFKLFGGVNKKYKERGRSLLFNLKDRSNPELRERVISGEISPKRLCSMTAEDLASKELSEWRMAKAEEFAQMIVLPDSDVDMRRLVKKTHKGEYQVEVEHDDGVSVEVSVGTTSFSQIQPKNKEARPPSEADEIKEKGNVVREKSSSEKDQSCSFTIPNDGPDIMQGLIVDELKDAEFLPPIVSLDEFMESLNSEPPFENLPVDAGQAVPLPDKEKESGKELVASALASKDLVDTTRDKADKVDGKYMESEVHVKSSEIESPVKRKISPESEVNVKSSESPVKRKISLESEVNVKSSESPLKRKTSPLNSGSMVEHVWEGVLQLNISAQVTVIGFFRSGEKTSTKEWPSSLEIKGRVRLDAFEKFLQELPMSRSRAVMVVHFALKTGSSENEHASLSEVADSYVLDERLGFAEPAPGAELYLCPAHARILEMLSKHLSKNHTEILNSMDNGLIGVVVWRKAHLSSAISPNHKHGSKKQQLSSRRQQEKDTNVNVNMTLKAFGAPPTNPEPPSDDGGFEDDDDDIPPGFGPAASRDEDDLPEFNFSGNSNPSIPKHSAQNPSQGSRMTPFHPSHSSSHPVQQMRELVHRYGQTGPTSGHRNWQDKRGGGLGIQPWNDDDDDIPEWQPQAAQQQPRSNLSMHGLQRPIQPHMINQHPGSTTPRQSMVQLGSPGVMPFQPPTNVMNSPQRVDPSWQQGARWVQPSGPHGLQPSSLGSQSNPSQYQGVPVLRAGQPGPYWRQDAARSRGF